jgi:hypothetical protein
VHGYLADEVARGTDVRGFRYAESEHEKVFSCVTPTKFPLCSCRETCFSPTRSGVTD